MPSSPRNVCAEPRCPNAAVRRGRCPSHAPARDGYSQDWRQIRLAYRRAHPRCVRCYTTTDLTVDHILPGGGDHPSNLRTLCRRCHALIGAKG